MTNATLESFSLAAIAGTWTKAASLPSLSHSLKKKKKKNMPPSIVASRGVAAQPDPLHTPPLGKPHLYSDVVPSLRLGRAFWHHPSPVYMRA